MLLERYYDDALAQASYLIGCERTREAILIDPNVLQRSIAAAPPRGLRVRYVTETHIHADFLSGSRAIAAESHAQLLLSGHGGTDWSYRDAQTVGARLLHDGDTIEVGSVRLNVLHTPGHTPEHICFVVTDTATGDRPMGMISGDFLFVGDVGRPDLLEKAAKVAGSMDTAARQLFQSLQRLEGLPDYLQIWPGHGAGSACGKALGAVPQTTLGYERLYNPALRHADEASFVKWVLEDQPEPPPYFATMKAWNRDGHVRQPQPDGRAALDASAVVAAIRKGHQVVDFRGSADFGKAHIRGTINLPTGKSLVTYAGTVLRYDAPIVALVSSTQQATRMMGQFALIGHEISGFAERSVLDEMLASESETLHTIDARALATSLATNGPRVIDVRGQSEWNHGHIPKATHIYLGDIAERTAALKHDAPIVVHCQSGTRSSIAASLLMARGFTDVTNFAGGFDAWRKAGLPVAVDDK